MTILSEKTGILLVNLGSPAVPTEEAVRDYLKEFLSDPRIVPLPRILWSIILHGIILRKRPSQSAEKYRSIWMKEGSPLTVHTQRQTSLLKGFLGNQGKTPIIDFAMRYGQPAIHEKLSAMVQKGCTDILILPLYPQYSLSTTESVIDNTKDWLKKTQRPCHIQILKSFHDSPFYIEALSQSIFDFWKNTTPKDKNSRLLISFHGLPQKNIEMGDPYYFECIKTAELLTKALKLEDWQWQTCFQSRFGKGKWLEPSTANTLQSLPKEGIKRLDIICPGFVTDCLETLEEIAQEGKQLFLQSGGKEFNFIPCLNEQENWIHALCKIIENESIHLYKMN